MTRPKLVGVLNVTPDSFSDGGQVQTPQAIISKTQSLIADGADVIDVGAESTRPGATPLSAAEEWQRLDEVWNELYQLTTKHQVLLSLDTRHAENARRALEIGVDWINDVSGFSSPEMQGAVRESGCDCVAMHALSIPADKANVLPDEIDVLAFMKDWCEQTMARLPGERLIIDPGIGFGKSALQSWRLLMQVAEWKPAKVRVLIGHSRKSFFSLFSDAQAAKRDDLTRVVSAMLAVQNVDYLRVHDVAGHRQLFDQLGL